MEKVSRIAACIIGDEILSGRTLDTNSHHLAKRCFDAGLHLAHIRVVPDRRADIVDSVRELSSNFALVFTSGGIGPTHDDITYASIADAFALPLGIHQPTVERMQTHYGKTQLNASQLRMATIPQTATVLQTPGLWVPLVQIRNVLILPGVPLLFTKMIDNWFDNELPSQARNGHLALSPRIRISLKTLWKESELASRLTEIQTEASTHAIAIGSYPKLFSDGSTFVVISVSGPADAQSAMERIAAIISKDLQAAPFEQ